MFSTKEEYDDYCKYQKFDWFLRSCSDWSEDEYIQNTQFQLDNFIPKEYYRQALISINIDIKSHYEWKKAKNWISKLIKYERVNCNI